MERLREGGRLRVSGTAAGLQIRLVLVDHGAYPVGVIVTQAANGDAQEVLFAHVVSWRVGFRGDWTGYTTYCEAEHETVMCQAAT